MDTVQQIVPISDFRTDQASVLSKLDKAPVVLAQRSKPRAVLVSVRQWDALAKELRQFRARQVAAMRARELDENSDLGIPFTDEELIRRGLIDD